MKLIGYIYDINYVESKEPTGAIAGYVEATSSGIPSPASIKPISDAVKTTGRPCSLQVYASWGNPSLNSLLTDTTKSAKLINTIANYLTTYGFSGVAFDWECSNTSTITPTQYTAFFKKLYAKLYPLGKTISATENYGKVTLLPEATNYLDYIGLMGYDVSPAETWYGTLQNVKDDLARWTDAGFPKDKLVIGISCAARPIWSAWYAGQPYHDTPESAAIKAKYVKDNSFGGVFLYHMGLDKLNDAGSITAAVYKELFPVPTIVPSNTDIQVKDSTGKVIATVTVNVK